MNALFEWLDGKKRVIGTALLLASQCILFFDVSDKEAWAQTLYFLGTFLGGSLAGIGVIHGKRKENIAAEAAQQ